MAAERLQKALARAGIASRRKAEELITAGRVRVNGRVVTELGTKVTDKDRIDVDGARAVAEKFVYIVLHKPRGAMSTMHDPLGRPTVAELLREVGARVVPVGRLDYATSGVLLCSNDGEFAHALLHPKKDVPKTYVVKVKGAMQPQDLDQWKRGVELEDGKTLPAQVAAVRLEGDKTWFELTIREGRNQQIRRMGEATGFRVMRLARVAFAGIRADGLLPGTWRPLTRDELNELKKTYGVPRKVPSTFAFTERSGPAPATRGGTSGARYGGGAPVRRSYEVDEDWGGTVGRSRGRSEQDTKQGRGRPRSELGSGGRGGRTRTTGTAGGPKAR